MAHSRSIACFRRALGPHFNLSELWDAHCYHEFAARDVDATMATMVSTPYVNHIPTLTGGVGHDQLKRFYKYHFVNREHSHDDHWYQHENTDHNITGREAQPSTSRGAFR